MKEPTDSTIYLTSDEQQALWERTNKDHGDTCRACELSEFDENGYFWGCQGSPDVNFPQDCPAVRRALLLKFLESCPRCKTVQGKSFGIVPAPNKEGLE